MNKINRNAACPCGSGKKYEKCCGIKNGSALQGLIPGIRMKGGVCFDEDLNAFFPIVHVWQNVYCVGDAEEWRASKGFRTEEQAMNYYKTYIRPELQRLTSEINNPDLQNLHYFPMFESWYPVLKSGGTINCLVKDLKLPS